MSNIFELFEADLNKEKEGAWVKLNPNTDAELKLRYFANQEYLEFVNAELESWMAANNAKVVPQDVSEELHTKGISKFVLVDWRNFTDKKGEVIEYSADKAFELLNNPNMRRFKAAVIQLSTSLDTFRVEQEEADVKN